MRGMERGGLGSGFCLFCVPLSFYDVYPNPSGNLQPVRLPQRIAQLDLPQPTKRFVACKNEPTQGHSAMGDSDQLSPAD